jgi:hypothetical protein
MRKEEGRNLMRQARTKDICNYRKKEQIKLVGNLNPHKFLNFDSKLVN